MSVAGVDTHAYVKLKKRLLKKCPLSESSFSHAELLKLQSQRSKNVDVIA